MSLKLKFLVISALRIFFLRNIVLRGFVTNSMAEGERRKNPSQFVIEYKRIPIYCVVETEWPLFDLDTSSLDLHLLLLECFTVHFPCLLSHQSLSTTFQVSNL